MQRIQLKRQCLFTAAVLTACLVTGCGAESESVAAVQSVAMLAGLADAMEAQTFAGIVSTGSEANVKKDGNKKVAKVYVKKGDIVKTGDKLFTYDAEQAQNSLEKAELELEEQKNALTSKEEEKRQLESDKQRARQEDQLDYTLKIQETDTEIRETQYNISLKEKEIVKLQEATKNLDVLAPIDGRVEKAGQADANLTDYSSGLEEDDIEDFDVDEEDSSGDAFIKLVEIDNYRIKGTIDETNISQITAGMQMVIHSRVDDSQVWYGVVSNVDYKSPGSAQGSSNYYGEEDDGGMTTTSKYPFYVSIDGLEGLMVGQHVYMTENLGDPVTDEIRLSASFISDADSAPWVFAEKNGVLEKRPVTLGEHAEEDDTYVITSGLDLNDFIAVPSSSYREGMAVTENNLDAFETSGNETSGDFYAEDGGAASDGETLSEDEEWVEDEEWSDDTWSEEDWDPDLGDEDIADIEARYRAAGEEIVG